MLRMISEGIDAVNASSLAFHETAGPCRTIRGIGRARPTRAVAPAAALLFAGLAAQGCGKDTEAPVAPPPEAPPRATTVAVTPAAARLPAVGATAQLSAQVLDQRGRTMTGVTVGWSSGDASVAIVDTAGLVTAVAQGEVTVTAAAGSVSGEAQVTVAVDEAALVAFYEAADGTSWTNSAGWLTDAPLGEWAGVETDVSGRVTGLTLPGNNLSGSLPPELGALTSLTSLTLHTNGLSGSIPPELGDLASLTRLDLGENNLSGSIPPELGALASLTILALYTNDLSGSIPPELGGLVSLTNPDLGGNNLSGPIPPDLGNLTSLTSLSLHTNGLSGAIPESFLGLARLQVLALRNNPICVPASAAFTAWLAGIEYHDTGELEGCDRAAPVG